MDAPVATGGVQRHAVQISASIGIAGGEALYQRAEQLLHDADAAMYRAKSRGTGCFEIFDPTGHDCAAAELATENAPG